MVAAARFDGFLPFSDASGFFLFVMVTERGCNCDWAVEEWGVLCLIGRSWVVSGYAHAICCRAEFLFHIQGSETFARNQPRRLRFDWLQLYHSTWYQGTQYSLEYGTSYKYNVLVLCST